MRLRTDYDDANDRLEEALDSAALQEKIDCLINACQRERNNQIDAREIMDKLAQFVNRGADPAYLINTFTCVHRTIQASIFRDFIVRLIDFCAQNAGNADLVDERNRDAYEHCYHIVESVPPARIRRVRWPR